MPLCASTGPVLGRYCQHRTSTGPVLATNGMFTGIMAQCLNSYIMSYYVSSWDKVILFQYVKYIK